MADERAVGSQMADILWASAQKEGVPPDMTRDKFLGSIGQLIKQGAFLLPYGKTVLMVKPLQQGTAELHTFTTEDGKAVVQAYIAGAKFAKKNGIKHVVSYADSPAFVKYAKQTGLPVKVSQTARMQGGQMQPMYQFDLDL